MGWRGGSQSPTIIAGSKYAWGRRETVQRPVAIKQTLNPDPAYHVVLPQNGGGMKRPNAKCETGHWRMAAQHSDSGLRFGRLQLG